MDNVPVWVGAVAALIVIATALGAAVAVYKTKMQETSLELARGTIGDMETEIHGFQRREDRFKADLELERTKNEALSARLHVVEDLLLRRQDDAAIKASIDEVRDTCDKIAVKVGVGG